jgi:methionyl-tRNA formyltransferase
VSATHAPILKREDGLIDWALDAADIEQRVRGFQPWPNAHTVFDGKRLVVWRAESRPAGRSGGQANGPAAGEVVTAAGDDLIIACGRDTALRLVEVQPEGKRRMSARDFINGAHVLAGARLG